MSQDLRSKTQTRTPGEGPRQGNQEPLITFVGVSLGYGRQSVLSGVDLSIGQGDFLGIVGPNGSGKTTLLRAILGTLRPQAGAIRQHPALAARTLSAGYVPQRGLIDEAFPLTVLDIILMGRYPRMGLGRHPRKEDYDAAHRSAAAAGIADLVHKRYRELSGGQKQRTLIARALTAEPNLLVLDEPTEGMDLVGERAIMDLICSLHQSRGLTVIMVSHLLNVVASYVRRLAIVGNGRVILGPVEEMLQAEKLSQIYQTPVEVHHLNQRTLVLTGGGHD
jgi:ABC-type Mn2+/Zn2+ transport system ATPase subunit